jgi:hypothetical protein
MIEQVASSSERQTTIWPRSADVMRIRTWKVILGVLVLVFAASAARANSIVNGSFEISWVLPGSFTNFITGSTGITGWTVVGPEASIVSGSYASIGFTFPAEDGKQWLDLTGDLTNSVEGVKQTFATTPGAMYNLSYFVGDQVNPGGPWGDDQHSGRTRERNADPDCDKLDGSRRYNTSLGTVHHFVPSHFLFHDPRIPDRRPTER